jgi:hypothetical protein
MDARARRRRRLGAGGLLVRDDGDRLPVELVLLTHGAPTDRAALERALS